MRQGVYTVVEIGDPVSRWGAAGDEIERRTGNKRRRSRSLTRGRPVPTEHLVLQSKTAPGPLHVPRSGCFLFTPRFLKQKPRRSGARRADPGTCPTPDGRRRCYHDMRARKVTNERPHNDERPFARPTRGGFQSFHDRAYKPSRWGYVPSHVTGQNSWRYPRPS